MITITHSQAGTKALYSLATSSRLVVGGSCRDVLNWLDGTLKVILLYVSGCMYREKWAGRQFDNVFVLYNCSVGTIGVLLAIIKTGIYSHRLTAAGFRWRRFTGYIRQVEDTRPDRGNHRTKRLQMGTRSAPLCTKPSGNSFCKSATLVRVRLRTLGKEFCRDPKEISNCRVLELPSFVKATS